MKHIKNFKTIKFLFLISSLSYFSLTQAENSVTLYGLIDAGLTVVSNQQGFVNYKVDTGVMQGNRWGLKGKEQLNENLHAIFNIEGGFRLDDGTIAQSGQLFGRLAIVGLEIKNVGTLTFGRQYDFMDSIGTGYALSGNEFATTMAYSIHKRDRIGGDRIDNSIKFISTPIADITGGILLGLGEDAQSKQKNQTISAILGYKGIKNLDTNIAFTRINKGLGKQQILAGAGKYDLGFGKINGLATFVRDNSALLTLKSNTYEIGYMHKITPKLSAGIGYQFFDEKTNNQTKDDIHNASIALDYNLSKRTDAYFTTIISKGRGNARPNLTGITNEQSNSNNQVALRVGLRHKF